MSFKCLLIPLSREINAGKDWRQEEKGAAEDWRSAPECEQSAGAGAAQGSLRAAAHGATQPSNWATAKRKGKIS